MELVAAEHIDRGPHWIGDQRRLLSINCAQIRLCKPLSTVQLIVIQVASDRVKDAHRRPGIGPRWQQRHSAEKPPESRREASARPGTRCDVAMSW